MHPANPYLREFEALMPDWRLPWPHSEERVDLHAIATSRQPMVWRYSWAVPSGDALELVSRYAPIVEVGAGTGYWTCMLRNMGVDVLAYDACPPGPETRNDWHPEASTWTHVDVADGAVAAAKHPDRTLMMSWPPRLDPMAEDALAAYQGDTVIYIGEWGNTTSGSERFFDMLETDWLELEHLAIPQWLGMHDYLSVHRRQP